MHFLNLKSVLTCTLKECQHPALVGPAVYLSKRPWAAHWICPVEQVGFLHGTFNESWPLSYLRSLWKILGDLTCAHMKGRHNNSSKAVVVSNTIYIDWAPYCTYNNSMLWIEEWTNRLYSHCHHFFWHHAEVGNLKAKLMFSCCVPSVKFHKLRESDNIYNFSTSWSWTSFAGISQLQWVNVRLKC